MKNIISTIDKELNDVVVISILNHKGLVVEEMRFVDAISDSRKSQ